jgi:transposase
MPSCHRRRELRPPRCHWVTIRGPYFWAGPTRAARSLSALPDTTDVRSRLRALAERDDHTWDPATTLRLQLLDRHRDAVADLDAQDREAAMALKALAEEAGSSLRDVRGIAERIEAGLPVEVGDPRRFAGEAGFARFNGTAPLPASSAEGDNQPIRHRLSRGGNRRLNACPYRIAITQLRCDPRARKIHDNARQRGHTKKKAMRILNPHLSDVVYRRMMHDLNTRLTSQPPDLRAAP